MKKAINPIKDGTVIDHIPAGKGMEVYDMLNLPPSEERIFLAIKSTSLKLGRKDILMFENLELTSEQLNIIALKTPQATISIIKNHKVVEKRKVFLPDFVEKIITCPNPNCITNLEGVKTKFKIEKEGLVKVKCHYCEKEYLITEVKIKM